MSGSSDQRLSIRLSFDGAQEARAQLEQLGQVGDTAMRKLEAGGQAAGRGVVSVAEAGNVLRAGLGQVNGELANTGRQFEALANSTIALTSALRSGVGLAGTIGIVVTAATAGYEIFKNWDSITRTLGEGIDWLTGRYRSNGQALESINGLLREFAQLSETAAQRSVRLQRENLQELATRGEAARVTAQADLDSIRLQISRSTGPSTRRYDDAERRLIEESQALESLPRRSDYQNQTLQALRDQITSVRQDRDRVVGDIQNRPEVLALVRQAAEREGRIRDLISQTNFARAQAAAFGEVTPSMLNQPPPPPGGGAGAGGGGGRGPTRQELSEAEREYQRLVQQGVQLAGTAATEQQRYGEQVLALSAALGAARITQEQYNAAVAALDPAARAAREAQEQAARQAEQFARRSRDALAQIGETAMDRIGTGLVNAFTSGGKAALDFQSLMKGVIASVAADLLKLAVVTPITNSIFGTARPTLMGAFGGGAQSSASGGGMLGSLGSFMPSMGSGSGMMESLGLSGIGASVSGFMAMPLFGSAAQASATNSALAAMPGGMMGPAAPSSLGLGATTVGSFLGSAAIGAGLGIAGGNFAGGLRGTANPMPGSMIGTGLGMGLGFLVGGPVGMAIGGALGGTAGGMFGPTKKGNAARSGGDVFLGTDANGQLVITGARGKRWDGGAATAEVQAQLDAINQQIGLRGLSFAGAGQAAVGFGAASGSPRELSLTSLVGQLRSGNANQMAAFGTLAGRGGNLEQALQAADFISQIFEPLGRAENKTGAFTQAMQALTKTYDEAITKARDLGLSEADLTTQRAARVAKLEADRNRDLGIIDSTLGARRTSLAGDARGAALAQFDLRAEVELRALEDQFLELGLERTHDQTRQRIVLLEQALADERLAVMKQFADEAKAKTEEEARAQAERVIQGSVIDRGLAGRRATLAGDAQGAGLIQFDLQAEAESRALRQQLLSLGFDENEDFARRMVDLEKVLADERLAVMKRFADEAKAKDEARLQFGVDADRNLEARRATLAGDAQGAGLIQFDLQAEAESRAFRDQLLNLGWEKTSEDFARRMVDLEKVLADERLAVMKRFADEAKAKDEARLQFGADFDRSLGARRATLAGDTRGASLMQFDLRAEQENRALKDQLRNLGFDDASEEFARRVVDLEKIIADERLAVMKEFDRQAQEQAKAQADRMRGITQGLLESLTLGDLGGLPLEARYGAALSSLSAAQRPLLDGATPDELAEFARVAQIALPIAKDFLGVSGSFAELVADVSRTLGTAAPGSDPANLGALLEAQVAGADRLELAVIGTGQAQTEVLQSLLKELKRLTAQNEAILARS